SLCSQQPATQHLCHTPCLRKTSPRRKGSFGFSKLTNRTQTHLPQLLYKWQQQRFQRCTIVVDTQMHIYIWADKPGPDGSLMIGTITLFRIAMKMIVIVGIRGAESAQTKRG